MINRHTLSAVLLSCIGGVIPASANDDAAGDRRLHIYGTPDGCLVRLPWPVGEDDQLRWKGPCTDEYASGTGTISILDKSGKPKKVYTGKVARGVPAGPWSEPASANTWHDGAQNNEAEHRPDSPANIPAPVLYFDNNSASLGAQATAQLDEFVRLLNDGAAKHSQISIHGHASAPGSADHNARLSLRRAEAVRAYLIARGTDQARLSASGKGSSQPAGPDGNAKENRRVTFVISSVTP